MSALVTAYLGCWVLTWTIITGLAVLSAMVGRWGPRGVRMSGEERLTLIIVTPVLGVVFAALWPLWMALLFAAGLRRWGAR